MGIYRSPKLDPDLERVQDFAIESLMSLFPMPKLSKTSVLFFLATAVTFPVTNLWAEASDGSQALPAGGNVRPGEDIPVGFKVERYAALWKRNPFTLVTPSAPQAHQSPFEKLSLASWFKDGGTQGIFVQNSDTNESERITQAPNKDNLRLIALHLNPDPKLVEAVISNGQEEGSVKFRLDVQTPPPAQPPAPAPQVSAASGVGQQPQKASQGPPNGQASVLSGTTPSATPPIRIKPGMPRTRLGPRTGQAAKGMDAVRLPNPGG